MWDKNDQRFFIVQTSYLNVGTKPEEVKDKKLDESSILPNPELKFVEEWKGQEINTFSALQKLVSKDRIVIEWRTISRACSVDSTFLLYIIFVKRLDRTKSLLYLQKSRE